MSGVIENHGPSHLGKSSDYKDCYDPALLDPIPRQLARQSLAIENALPFKGADRWTAYELSWLDVRGKPQVAMAEFEFPCTSDNIVESKSFKLYLNSFNQSRYPSMQAVVKVLEADLSQACGAPVMVHCMTLKQGLSAGVGHFAGESIDDLDVECAQYQPDADLLKSAVGDLVVQETLCSDLLKSNCPVTGQPDWASLYIHYTGPAIDRASLLRYIVSYRQHRDFHEHCVERIFLDILNRCKPEKLTVYARYTRRGGLDINPWRTNCGELPESLRLVRQ